MDGDMPPPFRLEVNRGGKTESQGTAWFVTRSKVITAWHVIEAMHVLPGVSFDLELAKGSISLEYERGTEDGANDIAVLNVRSGDLCRVDESMVLRLADHRPHQNDKWSACGFPGRRAGKEQTADGEVSNPCAGDGRLQLYLREGTEVKWDGMSGSAVIIDNRVVGIFAQQSGFTDRTAYAVPCSAIEKMVPGLQGQRYREKYREWFLDEFSPSEWSQSYAPKGILNSATLDPVDQISELMTADRTDHRVWVLAGSEADGREDLLKRIARAYARSTSVENEDYFNLPIWCTFEMGSGESDSALQQTLKRLEDYFENVSPSDVESIKGELEQARSKGRALFIADGADAGWIETLRRKVIGNCLLLIGVDVSAASEILDAQVCRIARLLDADRKGLASHWLTGEQSSRWVEAGKEFLPLAGSPLEVSIWCRAQSILDRVLEGEPKKPDSPGEGNVDRLKRLLDVLLIGQTVKDSPRSHGVSSIDETRVLLAKLAYTSLIDGVDDIDPEAYLKERMRKGGFALTAKAVGGIDQIVQHCQVLQKVGTGTYRFTHEVLQEFLAGCAMNGKMFDLNVRKVAEHANQIRESPQITRWARALAFRLDNRTADAKNILGNLLNYGLSEGYGIQLRNKSGPLSQAVSRAILHTEKLVGRELRKALGWLDSPDDWTGYRPDEWRDIEELLRYVDGVALRIRDGKALTKLIGRLLQGGKVIDIAIIRYALARELGRRRKTNERCEDLERLFERKQFFELSGHSISGCDAVRDKLEFRLVPEGWFFMGAPESEERSWPNERPRHRVRLREYWITRTELTNEQYEIFDPAHQVFRRAIDCPNAASAGVEKWAHHPVIRVSWYEAWCFAEWMGMRLPTEAQWEKAARGEYYEVRPERIPKKPMPYWFSKEEEALTSFAWFKDNSDGHPAEVDRQPSSSIGLDHPFELDGLCGNVWEWCMDEQGLKYTKRDRVQPEAFERPSDCDVITNRVIRGGSYDSPAWNCRHAVRHGTFPTVRANTIGFRLCSDTAPE
jgi:formylglycine-generating enzyme required for sulfatase activity